MQLRNAEVEQLRASLREDNVAWLGIAMSDAVAMRLVQRVGDLAGVSKGFLDRQRTLREALRKRLTVENSMTRKAAPLSYCTPDVVQRPVRMIQRRHGTRLALEPLQRLRITCRRERQHFDGNRSTEACVAL